MRRAEVFVLAGEPSGDMLGGRLIQALRDQAGDRLEFFGVGGPRMAERGLVSLFPMDELSLIGFTEVLPHLPHLACRLRATVREIRRRRPALALTIETPGLRAPPAAPAGRPAAAPPALCGAPGLGLAPAARRAARGRRRPSAGPAAVRAAVLRALRPRLQLRRPSDHRGGRAARRRRSASAGATRSPSMRP